MGSGAAQREVLIGAQQEGVSGWGPVWEDASGLVVAGGFFRRTNGIITLRRTSAQVE